MNDTGQPKPERDEQGATPTGDSASPQQPAVGGPAAPPPPSPYEPAPQPAPPQQAAPYPQPPAPYAQAPQQPYGQPQQPYAPNPYGYAAGLGPAAGPGQMPPQPPYPGQPPYPTAPQPPQKKKAWPWVLGGCLLVFVLGIGGCVGCVSCAMLLDSDYNGSFDPYYDDSYNRNDRYWNPYDNEDRDYGYGRSDSSTYGGVTLEDIKDAVGAEPGTVENGRCTVGVFEVGPGKDIEPGLYFLEGSADAESDYYVFDYDRSADSYQLDDAVVYFGNYFTELDAGDVVAYLPGNDDARMYPVAKAEFEPAAPYESGLYRVGTDMPAGTYTVTVDAGASAAASNDSAAYVMKDLDFDDDSITETKYVLAGGSQTITVKDGDYLELYAATATPAE